MSSPAFYDELRALRRERVLDAAAQIITEHGWDRLTMTQVSAASGIARQSLYKEVSSKAELGEAVVQREVGRFLAGIDEAIASRPDDLESGLLAAVRFSLEFGTSNALLKAILDAHGDADLLELLTTRPEAVLTQAVEGIHASAARHHASLPDEARLEPVLDALVRLTLSHMLQPTVPVPTAAARVGAVISCLLG